MSVTSLAPSLSADEDCLLLPSTPPRAWSPEEQRSTTIHCKRSTLAEDQPPSPWFAPENVDHRVSTVASHLFSALCEKTLRPADNGSDSSTTGDPSDVEVEVDGDRMFLCAMEEPRADRRPFFPAERTPRLLLGAWCSSRSTAASPSSHHHSRYQPVTTKHHLLAV